MTTPNMTLTEAANRLTKMAEALNRRLVDYGYATSDEDIEAVTFAAAFLGVFVESLEVSE